MRGPLPPFLFLVLVPLVWLTAMTFLGWTSGWFALMERYPDHAEPPILTLKGRSGSLGWVGMNNILQLDVCLSGLRVGMPRLFAPFCRPFLVPWREIHVRRTVRFFMPVAKLSFGQPAEGALTLSAALADRLAIAAGTRWPEPGSFSAETPVAARTRVLKQWLVLTALGSAFFIAVPRLVSPIAGGYPPVALAIALPAVVFGVAALIEYLRR